MFYDENLNLIYPYKDIVWDSGYGNFGLAAKQSQLIYYFSKLNLNKKICFITSVHNFDLDKINKSDVDLIVANDSDHPSSITEIPFTKPYVLLGSNFNYPNYHPFHLLFSSYCALTDNTNFASSRKYLASCINRSPRITRIYLLHHLRSKSYYKDLKINWYRLSEGNGPLPDNTHATKELGRELFRQFLIYEKEYPMYKPKTEYVLCSGIEDYTDSCLNIVAESRLEDIGYLTEKIYKPIRAGQLFLVQGPPGSISFLRNLGFDVFDDIIDHSYDSIADWKTRTDLMLSELDRIYDQLDTLYNKTVERRVANFNWLKSNKLIKDCLPKKLL
jgi:hypothetical protein